MQPDTSIGYPNGYQKDRKSKGPRGFSCRDRWGWWLFQRSEQELEEWGIQDKEYNRWHRQVKVDVEDTPRSKLPVLKAWLMFKEQDPSNDRHNNRMKARKCCLCRDKGSITCYNLKYRANSNNV
jgi:hypothetical protein